MKRKYILMLLLILITSVGIMMLETEGQHESKKEISITVDPVGDTEFSLSDVDEEKIIYCDTKEEAIANANPKMFSDYTYAMQVDTAIASIESKEEAIFLYLSYDNKWRGCYIMAKFYKEEVDGKIKYGLVYVSPSECSKHAIGYKKDPEENVRFSLNSSQISNMLGFGFEKSDERFVWGMSKLEEVNHLLLDGQRPDEVIKYEYFDTNWYFWYYRDLETNADVDDIKIEFEE